MADSAIWVKVFPTTPPADTGVGEWAEVTGGTVTEYTKGDGSVMEVHTFTADGTLTVVTPGYADVLIVGHGMGGYTAALGSGARVLEGKHALPAGSLAVVVPPPAAHASTYWPGSSLGSLVVGGIAGYVTQTMMTPAGAGGTAAVPATGWVSSISGTPVEYAKANSFVNPGDGANGNFAGKPGIVIVAVQKSAPTASGVVATGGTETTYVGDGTNGVLGQSYKVHQFTADGTFTVTQGGEADVLIVGGGAAGLSGFPGCGGDFRETRLTLGAGTVAVDVGAGGTDPNTNPWGQPSSFGTAVVTSCSAQGGNSNNAVGAGGVVGSPATVNLGRASSISGVSVVYGTANAASPVANRGDGAASGAGTAGVVIVRYKV
jgi:hypothetical protein